MLSFDRDGDDIGRLAGASAIEDECGTGPFSVIMGGLDENPTQEDVSCLSNGAMSLSITRGLLSRDETGPSHELLRAGEAADISNLGGDGHGREGFHAS